MPPLSCSAKLTSCSIAFELDHRATVARGLELPPEISALGQKGHVHRKKAPPSERVHSRDHRTGTGPPFDPPHRHTAHSLHLFCSLHPPHRSHPSSFGSPLRQL